MDSLPSQPVNSGRNPIPPPAGQVVAPKPVASRANAPVKTAVPPSGGGEAKEAGSLFKEAEIRQIEQKEFSPPPEVKEWVTEVKKEEVFDELSKVPFEDEYGQILMEQVRPSKPALALPLTEPEMKQGAHQPISNAIRWLVTLCQKLIKMFPGKAIYGSSKPT